MVPKPELSLRCDLRTSDSIGVFMSLQGLSARSRYLAFLMLRTGTFVGSTGPLVDGVRTLAKRFGYSPASFTQSARELVKSKMLVLGTQPTKGRPKRTYALNPDFKAIPHKGPHLERVHQLLIDASIDLSIPERVVLADLWLEISNKIQHFGDQLFVVDSLSITKLAKRTGQAKTTIHRILASLEAKEFILCEKGRFDRDYRYGLCNTYYLLGPESISDFTKYEWNIPLLPNLSKILSNDHGFSVERTVESYRSSRYPEFLKERLGWLDELGLRVGLVRVLCSQYSNILSWPLGYITSLVIIEAEKFLLKRSGLKNLIHSRYRGIENMNLELPPEENDLAYLINSFAGMLASSLSLTLETNVDLSGHLRKSSNRRHIFVRLVAIDKEYFLGVSFFEKNNG